MKGKKFICLSLLVLLLLAIMVFGHARLRVTDTSATANALDDSTFYFQDVTAIMHLLVGKDTALVIDTGFGLKELQKKISEITDLPVKVINTHGHFDHTHGNWQFDKPAMVSYKDLETISRHDKFDYIRDNFLSGMFIKILIGKKNLRKMSEFPNWEYIPLPESGSIDLGGGRVIKIMEIPGHTPGSIALLDTKYHRIYTGDMFCTAGVLLNLPESTDVLTYRQSVTKIRQLAKENNVSSICASHPEVVLPVDILEDFDKACERYLNGDRSKSEQKKNISNWGRASLQLKD